MPPGYRGDQPRQRSRSLEQGGLNAAILGGVVMRFRRIVVGSESGRFGRAGSDGEVNLWRLLWCGIFIRDGCLSICFLYFGVFIRR